MNMKNWVTACLRVLVGLDVAPGVIGWGRVWGGESQHLQVLRFVGDGELRVGRYT